MKIGSIISWCGFETSTCNIGGCLMTSRVTRCKIISPSMIEWSNIQFGNWLLIKFTCRRYFSCYKICLFYILSLVFDDKWRWKIEWQSQLSGRFALRLGLKSVEFGGVHLAVGGAIVRARYVLFKMLVHVWALRLKMSSHLFNALNLSISSNSKYAWINRSQIYPSSWDNRFGPLRRLEKTGLPRKHIHL